MKEYLKLYNFKHGIKKSNSNVFRGVGWGLLSKYIDNGSLHNNAILTSSFKKCGVSHLIGTCTCTTFEKLTEIYVRNEQ